MKNKILFRLENEVSIDVNLSLGEFEIQSSTTNKKQGSKGEVANFEHGQLIVENQTIDSVQSIKKKIIFFEDDPQALNSISKMLEEHFNVITFSNYDTVDDILVELNVDLALFDLFIEGKSSLAEIQHFKDRHPKLKIVMITGNPIIEEIVKLFSVKIDGMLTKPFTKSELLKVLSVFLDTKLCPIKINELDRSISYLNITARLTSIEYKIIKTFLQKPNERISRQEIIYRVWGKSAVSRNVFDTHLSNLRKKAPFLEKMICCVHGDGYYFNDNGTTKNEIE